MRAGKLPALHLKLLLESNLTEFTSRFRSRLRKGEVGKIFLQNIRIFNFHICLSKPKMTTYIQRVFSCLRKYKCCFEIYGTLFLLYLNQRLKSSLLDPNNFSAFTETKYVYIQMHKYLVQELRKEKIRPNIEMKYGCKLNRFPNKIPALANFSRQIMSPVAAPPLPKWAVAICMSTTNIHNTQLSCTLLRHKSKIHITFIYPARCDRKLQIVERN